MLINYVIYMIESGSILRTTYFFVDMFYVRTKLLISCIHRSRELIRKDGKDISRAELGQDYYRKERKILCHLACFACGITIPHFVSTSQIALPETLLPAEEGIIVI